MILDKALILKGLGGLTVLGGSGLAVYFAVAPSNDDSSKAKELKKSLGLPEDDNDCKLPTNDNETTTCSLNADKLKAIKFDGKGAGNVTIPNNGTVTLTITKVDSTDSIFGTGGYKFAFNSTQDLSIPKSTDNESISIKKGTNTEFRIKETPSTTDGTAKTLSLEKAWNITEWGKKVGLTNCDTSAKTCELPTTDSLKLYISESDKIENGKVTDNTKKLTFAEDAADHNQGFKFTTSTEISLSEPSDKKIESSTGTGNPTYEIKEIDGQWYLAKKTNSSS